MRGEGCSSVISVEVKRLWCMGPIEDMTLMGEGTSCRRWPVSLVWLCCRVAREAGIITWTRWCVKGGMLLTLLMGMQVGHPRDDGAQSVGSHGEGGNHLGVRRVQKLSDSWRAFLQERTRSPTRMNSVLCKWAAVSREMGREKTAPQRLLHGAVVREMVMETAVGP